jgi:hypothetical protein
MFQRYRGEHHRALFVICALICVAVSEPLYGAESTFDGVYAGKRVRTDGPPHLCLAEENVTVTITRDILKFTNGALQNFTLSFEPKEDGSFKETYDNISSSTVLVEGRIVGDTLDADVFNLSTNCKHHWHLTKEQKKQ